MPATVRDLAPFITVTTSDPATRAIGKLDDAASITIFMASSATVSASSGITIQVSQFDPFDPILPTGVVESTAFYNVSTSTLTSTTAGSAGSIAVLTNISFKGLRLLFANSSANVANEVVARASKQ